MYSVYWTTLAEISYSEEADFILKKWNLKEVDNFGILVDNHLKLIASTPFIGKVNSNNSKYSFVISKQTTLYYTIDSENLIIYLIVFWNNLKNPNDLIKLL
jgi:plasmid stabilization system protein ParE